MSSSLSVREAFPVSRSASKQSSANDCLTPQDSASASCKTVRRPDSFRSPKSSDAELLKSPQSAGFSLPPANRRGFLSGMASIFALAAPAAGAGVVAKATASFVQEATAAPVAAVLAEIPPIGGISDEAELLALGARMMPSLEAWGRALLARKEIMEAVAKAHPLPPELVVNSSTPQFLRQYADEEVDLIGARIAPDERFDGAGKRVLNELPPRCLTVLGLRSCVEDMRPTRRSKVGKDLHHRLAVAEAYETAKSAAVAASGFEAARDVEINLEHEFADVIEKIWRARAHTFAGIVVKADAIMVAQALPSSNWMAGWIRRGDTLAESIQVMARRMGL